MIDTEFYDACYEVLVILKHVKKEDLLKIPKEEIQMLKDNANFSHKFEYNPMKDIKEQKVLKMTKGIIAEYFFKYCASEKQKEKIKCKMENDMRLIEKEKEQKYNSNVIFKNEVKSKEIAEERNIQIIEYKEKWYMKLFKKILKWFKNK